MTTFADLRDRFLESVDDAAGATWDSALVLDWLGEAVEDYALHVPPRFTTDINAAAGVQVYALAGDRPRGVVAVEFPQGEDPPRYLRRKKFTDPGFWSSDGYYDFVDWGTVNSEKQLTISDQPAGTETIRVHWTGRYDLSIPPDAEDTVPVPEQHQHILLLFVLWRALLHRLAAESQSPSSSATVEIMRQLSTNADRAEAAYRRAIGTAQQNITHGGPAGAWRMDKWDGRG